MSTGDNYAGMALFAGLPEPALARMLPAIRSSRYPRGRQILETGEVGRDVFLLLEGRAVGVLISEEGKEVAYADLGQGIYFGEMAALDGGPRSLTVTAVTECQVGRIPGAEFLRWLEEEPALARRVMLDLIARIRHLNDRVFELIVHDVAARVRLHLVRRAMEAGVLTDGGVLDPAPTHSQIAAHIGANREAVSRVMARLDKAGTVVSGRQRITLRDVDALLNSL